MDTRDNGQGQPTNQQRPVRAQVNTLQNDATCDKMIARRKAEIFSQLARHMTAIVYLIAELHLGKKPEKL